ncbi:LolC/E family lipoprotein releasing system, transmembrane protein [Pseudomonas aeruginosa]|nr:LolC/E family lipoprotein releasing system, transmembrane protein [Pseudomonas aeruginosa]
MFRPLSVFIGTRYTRAKRRSHFVSFISLTSMIGLALGVLVMIVVLSVMNGFDREMRTRILGMVPQATVESYQPIDDWRVLAEKVKAHEHVTAVAPFTQMQGMLSANGAVQTVMVDAVDPLEEAKVSIIPDFFKQGSLAELKAGGFGIVIGQLAAQKLGVGIGDKVTLILPEVAVTPAGVFPRMKRFTVVGTFRVGAGELDGGLSLIHLEDAARLQRWKTNQVQGLRLKLDDLFQAPRVAWEIARTLTDNDFYARDWTRSHGNLYQAIRMEKTMIGLLLLLIVAVAAFNIISTLVMVVTDKKSDIAILRTLGATPGQIMATFMVQGTVIGGDRHAGRRGPRGGRGAQRQRLDFRPGKAAGPPVPRVRRVLHRLPAVATDARRCCAGLRRGPGPQLLRHFVSSLACGAHPACGGFAL